MLYLHVSLSQPTCSSSSLFLTIKLWVVMRMKSRRPTASILIYEAFASHKQCQDFISYSKARQFFTDDRWCNSGLQNQCLLVPGGTVGLGKGSRKAPPTVNLFYRNASSLCGYMNYKHSFISTFICHSTPEMESHSTAHNQQRLCG